MSKSDQAEIGGSVMSRPLNGVPIRFTPAMRRRYTTLIWAVIATIVVCAVAYPLIRQDSTMIVPSLIGAVVVGGLTVGLLLADRGSATYALHDTVLRSGGRRVDLLQVATAAITIRDPKWMVARNPFSTLALTDTAGGRIRMMFHTQRLGPLYEPADLRMIAELLARSGSPDAQDVARRLPTAADQGQSDIDLSL